MATTVRGWKNAFWLPGTEEIRWTISPSLKRTLKEGREWGAVLGSKSNARVYRCITSIRHGKQSPRDTWGQFSMLLYSLELLKGLLITAITVISFVRLNIWKAKNIPSSSPPDPEKHFPCSLFFFFFVDCLWNLFFPCLLRRGGKRPQRDPAASKQFHLIKVTRSKDLTH